METWGCGSGAVSEAGCGRRGAGTRPQPSLLLDVRVFSCWNRNGMSFFLSRSYSYRIPVLRRESRVLVLGRRLGVTDFTRRVRGRGLWSRVSGSCPAPSAGVLWLGELHAAGWVVMPPHPQLLPTASLTGGAVQLRKSSGRQSRKAGELAPGMTPGLLPAAAGRRGL